jgi:hypothetical protein
MFDIFADRERKQPELYIADIEVHVTIPGRAKTSKPTIRKVKLPNNPIVLTNGKFPTSNSETTFFRKIHSTYIVRGDFANLKFKITKMDNLRFSSKLMYKFDYDKD